MDQKHPEEKPPTYSEAIYGSPGTAVPVVGIVNPGPVPQFSTAFIPAASAPQISFQQPQGFVPNYGSTHTSQRIAVVPSEIIVIGGCPSCRIGFLEDYYSCLGILCAIAFFPIGILCCLGMKTKRCTNCGVEF
ncbi:hypothetical protein ACFFRR_010254 [Megaselia abdita]